MEHIEQDGLAMLAGALTPGLEGIVAKDGKSPYVEDLRVTWHWQKIKSKNYEWQKQSSFTLGKARVESLKI